MESVVPDIPKTPYLEIGWGSYANGIDGPKFYPVHQYQKQVLDSTTRFTAAIAGTGGGKTVVGPLWIAKRIQHDLQVYGTTLGMVLAPTYKVLSRATVPCLIETFKGTELEGEWKEAKNLYVLPNEWGKIWCQGVDSPGGIEGGQFSWIWGDEAGQFKFSAWIAIQGRTGAKQAPVLFTTTPYGKNWLFSEFYKRFESGDKDYKVIQWSSFRNPAYPKEEYERAKRSMTPEKAAMRYDGHFMKMEGLVFPDIADCFCDDDPSDILAQDGKLVGGIDFGWNDPFAALCGHLSTDDVLTLWYERYKSETPIEVHAERLPKFSDRVILWHCEHDPELTRRLQKGGHRCKKAIKAIVAGIDAVNKRIRTGKLRIIKNVCRALCAEAEVYAYPEEDEHYIGDKPIDKDNHACDALRYLVSGIDIKRAA